MEPDGVDLVLPPVQPSGEPADPITQSVRMMPTLMAQYLCASLKAARIPCRIHTWLPRVADARHAHRALAFFSTPDLRNRVIEQIRLLRNQKCARTVFVWGPDAPAAKTYLVAGADLVCTGEAEKTMVQIMEALIRGRPAGEVPGVCTLIGKQAVVSAPREPIRDLDALPFPDRDEPVFAADLTRPDFPARLARSAVLASRGGFSGFYATYWGRALRVRSAAGVLAEIEQLVGRRQVRYIRFLDEVFAGTDRFFDAFCEGMIRRRFPVRFGCNLPPTAFRDRRREAIDWLRRAGCRLVVSSMEVADPQSVRLIEQAECLVQTVKEAKRQGLAVGVAIRIDPARQPERSLARANRWVKAAGPHFVRLSASRFPADANVFNEGLSSQASSTFVEACARVQKRYRRSWRSILRNASWVLGRNPGWLADLWAYWFWRVVGAFTRQKPPAAPRFSPRVG